MTRTFASYRSILLVLVLAGLSWPVSAGEMTAFQLVREGNRFVAEDVKDHVVEIRSEKSVAGLAPNIWYITYYDPDATFKATEVKFGAGKKLEVKRPTRMLEYGTKESDRLDPKKLNVDSDKAISVACNEPALKGLTLRATQLWLRHSDDGPVWKVRVWAAKLRNPDRDADVGDVYVKANDGTVLKSDMHIGRVD